MTLLIVGSSVEESKGEESLKWIDWWLMWVVELLADKSSKYISISWANDLIQSSKSFFNVDIVMEDLSNLAIEGEEGEEGDDGNDMNTIVKNELNMNLFDTEGRY